MDNDRYQWWVDKGSSLVLGTAYIVLLGSLLYANRPPKITNHAAKVVQEAPQQIARSTISTPSPSVRSPSSARSSPTVLKTDSYKSLSPKNPTGRDLYKNAVFPQFSSTPYSSTNSLSTLSNSNSFVAAKNQPAVLAKVQKPEIPLGHISEGIYDAPAVIEKAVAGEIAPNANKFAVLSPRTDVSDLALDLRTQSQYNLQSAKTHVVTDAPADSSMYESNVSDSVLEAKLREAMAENRPNPRLSFWQRVGGVFKSRPQAYEFSDNVSQPAVPFIDRAENNQNVNYDRLRSKVNTAIQEGRNKQPPASTSTVNYKALQSRLHQEIAVGRAGQPQRYDFGPEIESSSGVDYNLMRSKLYDAMQSGRDRPETIDFGSAAHLRAVLRSEMAKSRPSYKF